MLVYLGQNERSPGTYHTEGAAQFFPFAIHLLGQCFLLQWHLNLMTVYMHAVVGKANWH